LATGTYALDRVKWRGAWIDPADLEAQPERYAFLVPRAGVVRLAACLMIVVGAAVGSRLGVVAWVSGLLAGLGVSLYAPGPRARRARIKDRVLLKNAYVGAGITGFAAVVCLAAASDGSLRGLLERGLAGWRPLLCACVLVFARVTLEAALCDLDDEAADRKHGTTTLPTTLGGRRAWAVTGVVRTALLVAWIACPWIPLDARVVWTVVSLVGFVLFRWWRRERVRDVVDARLPAEAVVAGVLLMLIRGGSL
jgi:4-hydroxybenzoate polyprenyltransferase